MKETNRLKKNLKKQKHLKNYNTQSINKQESVYILYSQ